MFIQVIQGRCSDEHRMHELTDEWRRELAPGAEGWLGGTYGITDDGQFLAVVRFESREAAERNSRRPEQGQWWSRMQECIDGEASFHDCEDVSLMFEGGSDDAEFVQVIQGRISDRDRLRSMMTQDTDALHEARPEILGGTLAIDDDGWFTETVAFRSESEAREGEQKPMPDDVREQFEQLMGSVQDLQYHDLHHPWFSSAGS